MTLDVEPGDLGCGIRRFIRMPDLRVRPSGECLHVIIYPKEVLIPQQPDVNSFPSAIQLDINRIVLCGIPDARYHVDGQRVFQKTQGVREIAGPSEYGYAPVFRGEVEYDRTSVHGQQPHQVRYDRVRQVAGDLGVPLGLCQAEKEKNGNRSNSGFF